MRRLTWFPKYVLGPALAAAVGYWLVGPRLAGDSKVQKLVREKAAQFVPAAKPEAPEAVNPTTEQAPQVTVGVKPAAEESLPRHRRRRRSHQSTEP